MKETILDILREYPADAWKLRFSDSRVRSRWALRVSGTCINPKGAMVTFEIFAPPPEAVNELGFVKVTVDTVCVYRQEWDGYKLAPKRSARDEVLLSPYWKWIEPRYEANLRLLDHTKRKEEAAEAARRRQMHDEAISKL